jgi:hypothetical protein
MKTINYAVVSAALIACSLSLAQASPRAKDQSVPTQVRMTLKEVDSLSASMADAADRLALVAKSTEGSETQLDELGTVRDDVNRIGRDLRTLQDEAGSLPAWESQTIDEVLPLMQEIATQTEEAIQNFNANRNHLWATAFPDETAKIYRDSERVKEIVSGNLKLAAHGIEGTLNQ